MSQGFVHATGFAPELLWPGIKSIFGNTYKEWEPIYSKFYNMETSDKAFEKVQEVTNLPKATIKGEGDSVNFDRIFQGYQKEYYHYTYAIGAIITREMVEDDQYGVIKKIPRFLSRSMRETEEVVAHEILNNGFTVNGPDGVPLYSASHPLTGSGGLLSNTLAVAADLTMTSLEQALIDISNFVDGQGNRIKTQAMTLIVPTALKFTASKILETQYAVGNADNDKNIIANMNIKLVVSPYLTDSDAWHIKTDVDDGLTFFTRRPAEIERDNDFSTQNLEMLVSKRFSTGYSDPKGMYGSPGA